MADRCGSLRRRGIALALAGAVACPALLAAGAAPVEGPALLQDVNYSFPTTPVGQTSTICHVVCFCQGTCSTYICNSSGTVTVNHTPSAPFSVYGYTLEAAGPPTCSGGTAAQPPVFIPVGQQLAFAASFSPTTPGSFTDYLDLNGLDFDLSGSTPNQPLVLEATSDNPDASGRVQDVNLGSTTELTFAAGELFTLQIGVLNSDGSLTPVPGQILLVASEEAQPPATSTLTGKPAVAFPGQVMLSFSGQAQTYMPVHSGAAEFAVTTASGTVAVIAKIASTGYHLGAANILFDRAILDYADLHGVPPQVVKAVVEVESGFNPNAYRYEPLTIDFLQISSRFSGGKDLRTAPAYAPYAVATATDSTDRALRAGGDLDTRDLGLRDTFDVTVDAKGRPLATMLQPLPDAPTRAIRASDPPVAMENILFTDNDDQVGGPWFTEQTPGQETNYLAFRQQHHLPFTAQTVLAASYGLMQVTIPTAVAEGYLTGQGVCAAPDALFDARVVKNISLDLGADTLATKYMARKLPTQFTSIVDFWQAWTTALNAYNGGSTYGPKVIGISNRYFPAP